MLAHYNHPVKNVHVYASTMSLSINLLTVAKDSIDALSATVVDLLYFFLSILIQLSCQSYGFHIRQVSKASLHLYIYSSKRKSSSFQSVTQIFFMFDYESDFLDAGR